MNPTALVDLVPPLHTVPCFMTNLFAVLPGCSCFDPSLLLLTPFLFGPALLFTSLAWASPPGSIAPSTWTWPLFLVPPPGPIPAAMALRPSAVALEWFKRGARGLFGGKQTRTGNKVSHAENKSRRTWKPNVLEKRLYSETLDRTVRWKVTASAWRTVKKKGGLDGYLLGSSEETIRFPVAIAMKHEIAAARAAAAGGGGGGLAGLAGGTATPAAPGRTQPVAGMSDESEP